MTQQHSRTGSEIAPPAEPPLLEHTPPSAEQLQLAAFFAEVEKKQVEFIDEAGKRIIELTTLLLGVLFTIVAFGDKFPPPYLVGNPTAKVLSILVLACYIVAMALAFRVVHPRDYRLWRYNLDGMRQELDRLIANKKRSLFLAGLTFWFGCLGLALLIGMTIWYV
jgi:hypothetical protein